MAIKKTPEIFLCVPCREAMKKEGVYITYARNSRGKGDCWRCGRRRFGDFYTTAEKK